MVESEHLTVGQIVDTEVVATRTPPTIPTPPPPKSASCDLFVGSWQKRVAPLNTSCPPLAEHYLSYDWWTTKRMCKTNWQQHGLLVDQQAWEWVPDGPGCGLVAFDPKHMSDVLLARSGAAGTRAARVYVVGDSIALQLWQAMVHFLISPKHNFNSRECTSPPPPPPFGALRRSVCCRRRSTPLPQTWPASNTMRPCARGQGRPGFATIPEWRQ